MLSGRRFTRPGTHNSAVWRRAPRIFSLCFVLALVSVLFISGGLARASQSYWDFSGNGYVTENSMFVGDAIHRVDILEPTVSDEWVGGEKKRKVTWKIYFNNQDVIKKYRDQVSAGENPGNLPEKGQAWGGRFDFFVMLPRAVDDRLTRIYRETTKRRAKNIWPGGRLKVVHEFYWDKIEEDRPGMDMGGFNASNTRWTSLPGDGNYESMWSEAMGGNSNGCNALNAGEDKKEHYPDRPDSENPLINHYIQRPTEGSDGFYTACELRKWKAEGHFGRILKSWEKGDYTVGFMWEISAYTDKNVDPTKLPLIAGIKSNGKTGYAVFGPYDTDGDGITDYDEFTYRTNPKKGNDFHNMSIDDAMPLTPSTSKGFFPKGKWEGDSSQGSFQYDKDAKGRLVPSGLHPPGLKFRMRVPNNGSDSGEWKTLLADRGYYDWNKYYGAPITIQKRDLLTGALGPEQPLKDVVLHTDRKPAKLEPGHAWVDLQTGDVQFNPKKDQLGKIRFHLNLLYPKPQDYNCAARQFIQNSEAEFDVWPMSHYFKPKYDETSVPAGDTKLSALPYNELDRSRAFPPNTSFVNRQYQDPKTKRPKGEQALTWTQVRIGDLHNGKVEFAPYSWLRGKNRTPVVVTYPDGSSSEDPYSGNRGEPVYAPVNVTGKQPGNNDLNLVLHSGSGPRNAQVGGPLHMDGDTFTLNAATGKPIDPFVVPDSWSTLGLGKISLRTLCKEARTNKVETGGINGMRLDQELQWEHAPEDAIRTCKAGGNCERDKYLYHDERNTTERSRALFSGTPTETGDYECTVYALKPPALAAFDLVAGPNVKNKNYDVSILPANQKGILWQSKKIRIKVHTMAYFYNPQWDSTTVKAGESALSPKPKSVQTRWGDGKIGDLPPGTKFEFGKYGKYGADPLPWAYFEDGSDGKTPGKTGDGRITFRPDKWMDAHSGDRTPVIVRYPDGSSSLDPDSGNGGNAIYAPVTVTRDNPGKGDLHLQLYENDSFKSLDTRQGINVIEGIALIDRPFIDSWSVNLRGKISLRMLCTPKGKNAWGEKVNGLTLANVHAWDHADRGEQEKCRADRRKCNPGKYLYDGYVPGGNSANTMERTQGIIDGTPRQSGDYSCSVYALKPGAEKKFNEFIARKTGGQPAGNEFSGMTQGIDWDRSTFPVRVVKKFDLPRTGGMGWNVWLGIFVAGSTACLAIAVCARRMKECGGGRN